MTDALGKYKHRRVQNDTRQRQHRPPQQQPRTVYEQQKRLEAAITGALDLVVRNAHIAQQAVIGNDALAEDLDAGFVLVVQVALHEPFRELDDLAEGEVLAWDSV